MNGLLSLSDYSITVFAFNVYIPQGSNGPNSVVCSTAQGHEKLVFVWYYEL